MKTSRFELEDSRGVVDEPGKEFVTRGEIVACGAGISAGAVRKAIACGALKGVRWPGNSWLRFRWVEVKRVFRIR